MQGTGLNPVNLVPDIYLKATRIFALSPVVNANSAHIPGTGKNTAFAGD